MNISVYDNVNAPEEILSKSSIYRTINDLLSVNGDVEVKIFCPLCVNSFEYKFSLFEHLRTFHNNFLTQAGNQSVRFTECPFCIAKFYGKHLTTKHALLHHSKIMGQLFSEKNKSYKCSFCSFKLDKKDWISLVKHLEQNHLLDVEEEFRKKFSDDSTQEMTISELINSTIQSEKIKTDSIAWENVSVDVEKLKSGIKNELIHSDTKDFEEASKINCYDFTELKEQLENIKGCQSFKKQDSSQVKKSILKDVKNSKNTSDTRKSVRRVLRFDLPDQGEDKENSVLINNLCNFKKITIDEHSLLCHNNKNEIDKLFNNANEISENWCGEPTHASTPNIGYSKSSNKPITNQSRGKNLVPGKSTFKSYICQNNVVEFEFQCGKCRKLFKENLELVCHVKNNHKKFSLKVLQPCYRCAICNARFFKNHYLRKHHSLHKPY